MKIAPKILAGYENCGSSFDSHSKVLLQHVLFEMGVGETGRGFNNCGRLGSIV